MSERRSPAPRVHWLRLLLVAEGLSFLVMAAIHFGLLLPGLAHPLARIPELTIGLVVLSGLALTWLWPGKTPLIAAGAQAVALLGTLVGLATIVVGVGPRTGLDLGYHAAILLTLAGGLVLALRPISPMGCRPERRARRRAPRRVANTVSSSAPTAWRARSGRPGPKNVPMS